VASRVLFVDDDELFAAQLASIARRAGFEASRERTFEAARGRLYDDPPDALVTNVRLKSFNGIHLAWLAHRSKLRVRIIVYADPHDPALAREAQRAGAFYERQVLLPTALPGYLIGNLPPSDRRNPSVLCRRAIFRGGRRAVDVARSASDVT
jgi:hypothetical protein